MRALQLVFDRTSQRLSIDDFNAEYSDFSTPPEIAVRVHIVESVACPNNPNLAEDPDDKNVVYDWLTREEKPYEACLTFKYYLPLKHFQDYQQEVNVLRNEDGSYSLKECRKLIERRFLRKFVAAVFGGDDTREERAGQDSLERFDFQFLNAVRDAEREMFYGNNTVLRDVLSYFLDYDLTGGKDFEGLLPENRISLRQREAEFASKTRELLEQLIYRISSAEIMAYASATGAEKGGKPSFDGDLSEKHLLFALRLVVEKAGFKLPIKNNGLGYNNHYTSP